MKKSNDDFFSPIVSHSFQTMWHFSREEFKQFLERPDLKQELVSQWQKDYNSIPDDLRKNEETKAELNHRLDVS